MDPTWLLIAGVKWLTKYFPSLDNYAEYAVPFAIAVVTGFGFFTNMLPVPGRKFPLPDVAVLEKELEGGGKLIIRLAKFTRTIVVTINWFLGTVIYSWFYNFTNNVSAWLPKFKKKPTT